MNRTWGSWAGLLLATSSILTFHSNAAQAAGSCGPDNVKDCGKADQGGFTVEHDDPAQQGPRPTRRPTGGNAPTQPDQPAPTAVVQTTYAPTCSENGPENADVMCMMAASICPSDADTAFWVWTRVYDTVTRTATNWVRVNNPPYVCMGATDPAVAAVVPVQVLIQGILTRGFAQLPLPKAVVEVSPPGGKTLVNVENDFLTRTGTQDLPPRVILGKTVIVKAKAERYDWHLGDGTDLDDAGPGSDAAPITHVYETPQQVAPYVTVTWSGTFTISGDPTTYAIIGTATTDGPPAALDVKTAGSELVAH